MCSPWTLHRHARTHTNIKQYKYAQATPRTIAVETRHREEPETPAAHQLFGTGTIDPTAEKGSTVDTVTLPWPSTCRLFAAAAAAAAACVACGGGMSGCSCLRHCFACASRARAQRLFGSLLPVFVPHRRLVLDVLHACSSVESAAAEATRARPPAARDIASATSLACFGFPMKDQLGLCQDGESRKRDRSGLRMRCPQVTSVADSPGERRLGLQLVLRPG
eukprot:CAMPEP_0119064558 /NCGR_PEP_ID=MMETSP1178-20130426/7609_1 /TAXON_ID=33656 /ORGANISM="unid sp, Strain CCMP2000" /LENGTH=220 /DNA_ID=CAMNT_0007046007 /DNA_START=10 /DNA_END=667 /DNA_ORIENTATION=+